MKQRRNLRGASGAQDWR